MSTNGDWVVKTLDYNMDGFFIYADDVLIARVYGNDNDVEIAQLIKLAPKMFQSLKDCENIIAQHDLPSTWTDEVRKVTIEKFVEWWHSTALKVIEEVKKIKE